jgi:hypothetical protein
MRHGDLHLDIDLGASGVKALLTDLRGLAGYRPSSLCGRNRRDEGGPNGADT